MSTFISLHASFITMSVSSAALFFSSLSDSGNFPGFSARSIAKTTNSVSLFPMSLPGLRERSAL